LGKGKKGGGDSGGEEQADVRVFQVRKSPASFWRQQHQRGFGDEVKGEKKREKGGGGKREERDRLFQPGCSLSSPSGYGALQCGSALGRKGGRKKERKKGKKERKRRKKIQRGAKFNSDRAVREEKSSGKKEGDRPTKRFMNVTCPCKLISQTRGKRGGMSKKRFLSGPG